MRILVLGLALLVLSACAETRDCIRYRVELDVETGLVRIFVSDSLCQNEKDIPLPTEII